ncbi:hypothetical protein ACFFSW_08630 [Saccharothrix longispora]|uniref:Uncharacterized protein n=1 Tax=Saccharothrix longispora TaxID=33920 RepID=A0ABU1Q723_9PSEU|nr:hypothetical protein [Saccharothrix longispora]MDR6598705.1 hypothetical protein [Saccharothrix longispora]
MTTIGGVRITPDLVLDDVTPAGSGMLVLPGGDSWEGGGDAPFAVAARRRVGASALEFAREVFAELDLYGPGGARSLVRPAHSTGDPAWFGRPVDA